MIKNLKYYFIFCGLFGCIFFPVNPGISKPLDVPEESGHVYSSWEPETAKKRIIFIRDGHCISDIQQNIANLLEYFIQQQQISLIALEGASGKIDTSVFAVLPDATAKEKVSYSYLKKGIITGAEKYAICSDPLLPVVLWGIEDESLYIKNLRSFRNVINHKSLSISYLDTIISDAEMIKSKIYPEQLQVFDKTAASYHKGEYSYPEWIRYLNKQCEMLNIDNESCSYFNNMLECLEIMDTIDHNAILSEIELLLNELRTGLEPDKYEQLVTLKKKIYLGKSRVEQCSALFEYKECENYPNLVLLKKYFKLKHSFLPSLLTEDLNRLEAAVRTRIITDSQDASQIDDLVTVCEDIHTLSKTLAVFSRMFSLELAFGEYEFYQLHKKTFSMRQCVEKIHNYAVLSGMMPDGEYDDYRISLLERSILQAERFYTISDKRSHIMCENLLNAMDEFNEESVVLIAGGFHSDVFEKEFRKRNIAYTVISPSCLQKGSATYIKLMSDTKFELFATEHDFLVEPISLPFPIICSLMTDESSYFHSIRRDFASDLISYRHQSGKTIAQYKETLHRKYQDSAYDVAIALFNKLLVLSGQSESINGRDVSVQSVLTDISATAYENYLISYTDRKIENDLNKMFGSKGGIAAEKETYAQYLIFLLETTSTVSPDKLTVRKHLRNVLRHCTASHSILYKALLKRLSEFPEEASAELFSKDPKAYVVSNRFDRFVSVPDATLLEWDQRSQSDGIYNTDRDLVVLQDVDTPYPDGAFFMNKKGRLVIVHSGNLSEKDIDKISVQAVLYTKWLELFTYQTDEENGFADLSEQAQTELRVAAYQVSRADYHISHGFEFPMPITEEFALSVLAQKPLFLLQSVQDAFSSKEIAILQERETAFRERLEKWLTANNGVFSVPVQRLNYIVQNNIQAASGEYAIEREELESLIENIREFLTPYTPDEKLSRTQRADVSFDILQQVALNPATDPQTTRFIIDFFHGIFSQKGRQDHDKQILGYIRALSVAKPDLVTSDEFSMLITQVDRLRVFQDQDQLWNDLRFLAAQRSELFIERIPIETDHEKRKNMLCLLIDADESEQNGSVTEFLYDQLSSEEAWAKRPRSRLETLDAMLDRDKAFSSSSKNYFKANKDHAYTVFSTLIDAHPDILEEILPYETELLVSFPKRKVIDQWIKDNPSKENFEYIQNAFDKSYEANTRLDYHVSLLKIMIKQNHSLFPEYLNIALKLLKDTELKNQNLGISLLEVMSEVPALYSGNVDLIIAGLQQIDYQTLHQVVKTSLTDKIFKNILLKYPKTVAQFRNAIRSSGEYENIKTLQTCGAIVQKVHELDTWKQLQGSYRETFDFILETQLEEPELFEYSVRHILMPMLNQYWQNPKHNDGVRGLLNKFTKSIDPAMTKWIKSHEDQFRICAQFHSPLMESLLQAMIIEGAVDSIQPVEGYEDRIRRDYYDLPSSRLSSFIVNEKNEKLLEAKIPLVQTLIEHGVSDSDIAVLLDMYSRSQRDFKLTVARGLTGLFTVSTDLALALLQSGLLDEYVEKFGFFANDFFISIYMDIHTKPYEQWHEELRNELTKANIQYSDPEQVMQFLQTSITNINSIIGDLLQDKRLDPKILDNNIVNAVLTYKTGYSVTQYSHGVYQKLDDFQRFVTVFNERLTDVKPVPSELKKDIAPLHVPRTGRLQFTGDEVLLFKAYKERIIPRAMSMIKSDKAQIMRELKADMTDLILQEIKQYKDELEQGIELKEKRINFEIQILVREKTLALIESVPDDAGSLIALNEGLATNKKTRDVRKYLYSNKKLLETMIVSLLIESFTRDPDLATRFTGLTKDELSNAFLRLFCHDFKQKLLTENLLKDSTNAKRITSVLGGTFDAAFDRVSGLPFESINMHFTKGLLGELAPDIGVACYSEMSKSYQTAGNIVHHSSLVSPIIFSTGHDETQELIGSAILLENTIKGEKTWVLRAINPNPVFAKTHNMDYFLDELISSLEPLAVSMGVKHIALATSEGVISNRDEMEKLARTKYANFLKVSLDNYEDFNQVSIATDECIILKSFGEQPVINRVAPYINQFLTDAGFYSKSHQTLIGRFNKAFEIMAEGKPIPNSEIMAGKMKFKDLFNILALKESALGEPFFRMAFNTFDQLNITDDALKRNYMLALQLILINYLEYADIPPATKSYNDYILNQKLIDRSI